jgi:hypothetical protein
MKVLLLTAVVWGVGGALQRAWRELGDYEWAVSWPWALAAGGFYLLGLLPAAWYWRQAIVALGGRPDWPLTLRAYFAGHLAKYVPGKVLVVVLRAGMLTRQQVPMLAAIVAVFLETLTTMAVGAFLVAALAPLVVGMDWLLVALAVAVAVAVGLPTVPPVARWCTEQVALRKWTGQRNADAVPIPIERIDYRLMAEGWAASFLLWISFGASLGAMLRAVGVTDLSLVNDAPLLVASVALATVAGFVSFLPGGLGVRDAVILGLLAPRFGDATALLAAVGVRLIWLLTELAVCGILYIDGLRRGLPPRTTPNPPKSGPC